jgi:hypothetical protein
VLLTLARLRDAGYRAEVVGEPGKPFLGFADVLAVRNDEPACLAIQATNFDWLRLRTHAIRSRSSLRAWLAAGNRAELWAWDRRPFGWVMKRVPIYPGVVEGSRPQGSVTMHDAPELPELPAVKAVLT